MHLGSTTSTCGCASLSTDLAGRSVGLTGYRAFAPPHGILHAMEEKILGASGTVPFILDSAGVLSALDKAAGKGEYVGEAVAASG